MNEMKGDETSRVLDASLMATWTIRSDYTKARSDAASTRKQKDAASNSLMGAMFVLAETLDAAGVDVLEVNEGERTLSAVKAEKALLVWACAGGLMTFAELNDWLQKHKDLGFIK